MVRGNVENQVLKFALAEEGGYETRYRNIVVERLEELENLTTGLLKVWDNEADHYKLGTIQRINKIAHNINSFTSSARQVVKAFAENESFYSSTAFHDMATPLAVITFTSTTVANYWTRMNEEDKKKAIVTISENGQKVGECLEKYLEEQRQKRLMKL